MPKQRKQALPRATLWDALEPSPNQNNYCNRDDLTNEASVEHFFLARLLADLGYKDSQIKTKESIDSFSIGLGHKKVKYKPDYVLKVKGQPRCVIDAKAPSESLDKWIEQCAGYCLSLNRQVKTSDPVRFFVLSNGITTAVYEWNKDESLLTLDFSDFTWENPKYEQLKELLGANSILKSEIIPAKEESPDFKFTRPTSERARQLFVQCHRAIWKAEGYGPTPAFIAFVKVMFVKLWCDRRLRQIEATRDCFKANADTDTVNLPASHVMFSVKWIENRETDGTINPIDAIPFRGLRDDLELKIEMGEKKRLFDKDERIGLRPYTVKDVVRRLQHFDMFGIDEDLNGRLFETFLNTTMRGRDLGQFFTPRSVVKMITRLADLRADKSHQDKVIDGCCGSGGFLIEALTIMRNRIRENKSLSETEKKRLMSKVSNECMYGIDYGKDPPLSRIARINMYLHGDGGSRIYYADALDKNFNIPSDEDPEVIRDARQLQANLEEVQFDVALTNPPFSMTKEARNDAEKEILEQYDIAKKDDGTEGTRSGVLSSVLFLERYWDLLRVGGRLLIVVDDSILASSKFGFARDFIRQRYLIRAIISLPGDAFKRSGSRVKTSVLVLEKKSDFSDDQPSCFGYFAEHIGVDDLTPRATESEMQEARKKAEEESQRIIQGYRDYLAGKPGEHLILPPERLKGQLDLKNCAPNFGRLAAKWRAQGIEVRELSECVTLVEDEVIPTDYLDVEFNLLKVTYSGECQIESKKKGKDIRSEAMWRVREGQVIFSIIRATDGAIAIVPEEMHGALATKTSYNLFKCQTPEDAAYLWAVLRSHELRADMQSISSGYSRYYTYWSEVRKLPIPWLPFDERRAIGRELIESWALERKLAQERRETLSRLDALGIESEESRKRWKASKVPS